MKKILVIEDETILRENIVALLEAEDFEVIAAENGLIGLKIAISELPDVILCDMMMPELDGYGVLTMLRQEPTTTTTPFIFLTARSTKSDFRQGMELGADDYLTKPFTRAELLKAIAIRLTKQATFKKHLSVETPEVTPREQAITIGLRQALQNQEFEIHYQPQVDLQT
ncbi:MAG: response regulator, partial [Nostocaceae cyanobacterium]|nr:response regulator [Nostocaceae cyanobacterium]